MDGDRRQLVRLRSEWHNKGALITPVDKMVTYPASTPQRMRRTTTMLCCLLVCSCEFAHCADGASRQVPPQSKKLRTVPPYATKVVPKAPTELVTMDAGDKGRFSVVVYSKRSPDGQYTSLKSDIFVFDKAGLQPKLIWQSPVEEFYEPSVYGARDWIFKGQPVLVVLRQAGAAATVADVISITAKGRVTLMARLLGERIDVVNPSGSALSILALYERPDDTTVSLPRLLAWDGSAFRDTSGSFPSFYRQYLKDISYRSMLSSDFSIQDRFCLVQLLTRAGQKNEARQLAQALMKEADFTGAKNTKLIAAIRNSLIELGNR